MFSKELQRISKLACDIQTKVSELCDLYLTEKKIEILDQMQELGKQKAKLEEKYNKLQNLQELSERIDDNLCYLNEKSAEDLVQIEELRSRKLEMIEEYQKLHDEVLAIVEPFPLKE